MPKELMQLVYICIYAYGLQYIANWADCQIANDGDMPSTEMFNCTFNYTL